MATLLVEHDPTVEVRQPSAVASPRASGAAVAAIISVAMGMITLALVNLGTQASKAFNEWVHGIGKLWMPGAEGIGPYSGKETLSLVVWVGSWIILHFALRQRDLNMGPWLVAFLVGAGIATTLLWPPVFEYLAGH